METVIALIAVAVLAAFIVLSIPLDLALNLDSAAEKTVQVRLVWFFGLLNLSVSGRSQQKRPPRKRGRPHRRRFTARRVFAVLGTSGFLATVARWMRRTVTAVRMREFNLRVRFGFDDPADTGLVLAAAAPAAGLLRAFGVSHVSAEPDFDKEVFRISGNLTLRIFPVRIIAVTAMFLLSASTLRAAKTAFLSPSH